MTPTKRTPRSVQAWAPYCFAKRDECSSGHAMFLGGYTFPTRKEALEETFCDVIQVLITPIQKKRGKVGR